MRRPDDKTSRRDTVLAVWLPALMAVGIMVTGFFGTLMVLRLDTFRPRVGDIVVFRPNSQDRDTWQLQVPATSVSGPREGSGCVLNPSIMGARGGSLVVEARRDAAPQPYVLHWAGARTENGPTDCGQSADLSVTRIDLQKLANAAGGFGVGDKGLTGTRPSP